MDRSSLLKPAGTIDGAPAREAGRPVPQGAPSTRKTSLPNPDDLVARALTILDEENVTSGGTRFLQGSNIARGSRTAPAGLTLQRRVLSDGSECALPLRYFDVQCLVATFLTDLNAAAELLNGTGLQAVPQEDGKGVAVLYFIEYRDTDIGPYNEVGLTVVAAAAGERIPANYVVNLPVTTTVANRAGREIWGYNKFVGAIDVESDGRKFSTILRDTNSEMIGALEGTRGPSAPAPPTDTLTFTMLKGRVIKTLLQVFTPFQASRGDGFVFRVGPSGHPMASNLKSLGLDGACPVLVHYADPFQALLFPGRAV
jgi:hypothetical protein